MKKNLVLACTLALIGLSPAALAAEGGQGFVRAEIGNSDVEVDVDGFGSDSDDDSSYSLRGGYWFTANWGVEAFYSNLYDKSQGDGVAFELAGYGLGVVGKKNFGADGNGFFISGRAGVTHLEGKVHFDGLGSTKDSSNKPYVGAGVGYDFSEMFGISLNYDLHKADVFDDFSVDADTVTLGAEMRF